MFIDALWWPHSQPDLTSMILSPEAFCAHWWQAKEHTSSSHLGLHFSHFKATTSSLPIAHLHTQFMLLVFMTGTSLSRDQSGLQVILEKKPGAIHINLLWAILLMEMDFNAAMKLLIGHCMVCNAILARAIPQECFGSQPEHTAIQVSLNWCLIADTLQQCCTMLAVTMVDYLMCYNSVAHNPASLTCHCLGTSLWSYVQSFRQFNQCNFISKQLLGILINSMLEVPQLSHFKEFSRVMVPVWQFGLQPVLS